MPPGSTTNFTVTRDKLIELAHKMIGVLEPGQGLDSEQLQDGIQTLSLIVRETDVSGKWLWTIDASSPLTLAAATHRYTSANGLPSTIADLVSVQYRNALGQDLPLTILKAEQYEAIEEKMRVGVPERAYLTEHRDLASRVLFLYPMLATVSTGSVVTGTDALAYKCIYPHVAAAVTQPITGANYPMSWALGGSGPAAWASGTSYTCTEQVRLTFRRPLFDFDTAADTPDFPLEWPRTLVYKLAFDLGDLYGIPLEERRHMIQKAKGAFDDLYPSVRAKSKNIHNKTLFY